MAAGWRWVAAVFCVGAVGVPALGTAASASVSRGTEETDPPVVDGTTITWTYRGEQQMPFFEAGLQLSPKVKANIASIDCGEGGEENPAGGPDGAFECGYHPAVSAATVVLTGDEPWFEVQKTIKMTPYTSYDDQTYEIYEPITVKQGAPGKLTKEEAGAAYLDAVEPVNEAISAYKEKVAAWTDKTKGTQAAKDGAELDEALDAVVDDLEKLKDQYKPAEKAINAQIKAVKKLKGDITAAGGINEGLDKAKFDEQLDKHIEKVKTASDKVRAKLGLPATNSQQQIPAE